MSVSLATLLRLGCVGAAAAASLASTGASPGERAPDARTCYFLCPDADPYRPDADPVGNCPSGETCSPATPNGLWFVGPSFGDEIFASRSVKALAIGGTQYVTVASDSSGTSSTLDFDVASNGPSLEIAGFDPPRVTVVGGTSGSAHLRVLEPETGLLYDRISISTVAVAAVVAAPDGDYLITDLFLEDAELDGVAVWVGGNARVVLQLVSTGGGRLVDQSMTVALPSGVGSDSWDIVDVAPTAPGTLRLGVTSGSDSFDVTVPAVDSADAIVGIDGWYGSAPSGSQRVGQVRNYCFRATNADRLILGAIFEFNSTNQLSTISSDGACVRVEAVAVGTALLDVSVGTRSRLFPIEVTAEAAGPTPRPALATPTPASAGTRAR